METKSAKYCSYKANILDYILVVVAILFTGKAVEYTSTIDFRVNPFGGITFLFCVLYMIAHEYHKIKSNELLYSFAFACLILILQYIVGHKIDIVAVYTAILFTIFSWLLVKRLSYNLLLIFERVTVYWSVLCLIMYILQEFLGKSVLEPLAFAKPSYNSMGSFIFYSLSSSDLYEYNAFDRNYGFAWEPGLYASILCTAIVINIYLHKGKLNIKNNKSLIVLLLNVISTGSTTGYMALAGIFLFEILKSKKWSYKIISLSVLLPLFFYIYNNTDFLNKKIEESSNTHNFTITNNTLDYSEKEEIQYTPQRFEGIALQFQNVIHEPIVGYGFGQSWVRSHISQYIAISTGILAVFAQFGIIIGFLYIFVYLRSYRQLGKHFSAPSGLFLVCYLMISVSYSFVFMPLYLCINLFSLFNRTK